MKNLFLASSFSEVDELFCEFEGKELAGKSVTFIPTASIHEEVAFYVDDGKESLEKLGLTVDVLEVSTASDEDISSKLENCDYIYVTGGNTFFLLQELKKSGADQLIIKHINSGKTYIGESAGSIILSPNIEYISLMDDSNKAQELSTYNGLGVIAFYPLPHYLNFPFQETVENIVLKFNETIDLRLFSNNQAILVKGDNVKVEDKA